MKVAVTGADGQLGTYLCRALEQANYRVMPLMVPAFDLLDKPGEVIHSLEPDVIIHGAAMTNVDGCTENPELAIRTNGLATAEIARAAQDLGARMIYVSSNEVFPGTDGCTYYEHDAVRSVNAYGRSKLAGEVLGARACSRFSIARLSWVFGPGFSHFPKKMCALADSRDRLGIVADEVANPTYAPDAAEAIVKLLDHPVHGIFHLCNEGAVSRYEFARAVFKQVGREDYPVDPVELKDFKRISRPPQHSPMGNEVAAALGIRLRPWQDTLAEWAEQETWDN